MIELESRNPQDARKEIIERQRDIMRYCEIENREMDEDEQMIYNQLEGLWHGLDLHQEQVRAGGPLGPTLPIGGSGSESIRVAGEYQTRDLKQLVESRGAYRPDTKVSAERKALRKYLKLGLSSLSENEYRDLFMDDSASGGFAVTPYQVLQEYLVGLNDRVRLRQQSRIQVMETAETLRIADLISPSAPTWGAELSAGATDTTMAFTARDWTPHPASQVIKVSKKLLRARGDIENLVREQSTEQMSILLEESYFQGTGSNRPLGLFVASDLGIPTSRDIQTATTGAVKADDLYNVKKTLSPQYRVGARWYATPEFEYRVSVLKTGSGAYIFQPSLQDGTPGRLLGYPLEVTEFAPGSDWNSGDYVAILGNPKRYLITDAMSGFAIQVLLELYAAENKTGFHVRFESDGNITDPNGWVRLQIK